MYMYNIYTLLCSNPKIVVFYWISHHHPLATLGYSIVVCVCVIITHILYICITVCECVCTTVLAVRMCVVVFYATICICFVGTEYDGILH